MALDNGVQSLSFTEDGFVLGLADGSSIGADQVIVATGPFQVPPNRAIVTHVFDTREAAQAFADNPELKEMIGESWRGRLVGEDRVPGRGRRRQSLAGRHRHRAASHRDVLAREWAASLSQRHPTPPIAGPVYATEASDFASAR
jgi:hypothetical protein